MGRLNFEDERGKQRLKDLKHKDKFTCANCLNQTFILNETYDFPFFDCVCSKCGSSFVWKEKPKNRE